MKELILSAFTLIISLVLVILFIALGWYVVWKIFLSKFKFVRELLGKNDTEPSSSTSERVTQRRKLRKD